MMPSAVEEAQVAKLLSKVRFAKNKELFDWAWVIGTRCVFRVLFFFLS